MGCIIIYYTCIPNVCTLYIMVLFYSMSNRNDKGDFFISLLKKTYHKNSHKLIKIVFFIISWIIIFARSDLIIIILLLAIT